MVNGLKPIYDDNSKILILGSLPSVKSIERQEYYANSSNHFWKILKYIYNEKKDFKTYEDKKQFLKKHNIALWDVIKCADRKGSLDSNIKNEVYNDIISLINKSNIDKVFINGRKAEMSIIKYMKNINTSINYILLPSSSSANVRYSLKEKINEWKKIIK